MNNGQGWRKKEKLPKTSVSGWTKAIKKSTITNQLVIDK
jgi:hypothetical protein